MQQRSDSPGGPVCRIAVQAVGKNDAGNGKHVPAKKLMGYSTKERRRINVRSMKRGLAVFLAVLLMMPAMPVSAGEIAGGTAESQEIGQTQDEVPGEASGTVQAETPGTGSEGEPGAGTGEVPGTASEV